MSDPLTRYASTLTVVLVLALPVGCAKQEVERRLRQAGGGGA